MFQNLSKNYAEDTKQEENISEKTMLIKAILSKAFEKHNILLYILGAMLSAAPLGGEEGLSFTPFGIAILAATMSHEVPIGILYFINMVATGIRFGTQGVVNYLLITLVFFVSIFIVKPRYQEEATEKQKVGLHLIVATLIVQVIPLFFQSFLVYDMLLAILLSITTFIFYKIFAGSITVIREYGYKKVFSMEEVIGASVLLAIAVSCFGEASIFGFSIRNILSILVVLTLGWKNGMLVGATSGITTGIVIGILGGGEITQVASYAISGLIAGMLNRFGKVGVIVGFILGNVILTYVDNGNTQTIILWKEILIASLGLLLMPKNMGVKVGNAMPDNLLPETTGRTLDGDSQRETVKKLNHMSQTIEEMAKNYQKPQEENEKQKEFQALFETELSMLIEEIPENLLYEEIKEASEELLTDIFKNIQENDVMTRKQLIELFEKYNNYIGNYEVGKNNKERQDQIDQMIAKMNRAYRNSKVAMMAKQRQNEDKQTLSDQLNGVSRAISNLAEEIKKEEKVEFEEETQEIKTLLEQKEIKAENITIKKQENGRKIVRMQTKTCTQIDGTVCPIKNIEKVLHSVLNEKMQLQKQECGLRQNKPECKYTYFSKDKLKLTVGVAQTTKKGSPVSGDSWLDTKLEDGKFLIAISDGMGSGPEARKSSQIAIKMLERMLYAGFNKEDSLKSINSTIYANAEEDMYATLDIQILDLYKGNMEFIKNGACPTFIKRKGEVTILKSNTLPAGVMPQADLEVYDKDLEEGDIMVICSDGIIESNHEYLNKEMWIKYLLEDMNLTDPQKIADIILQEAIDNDYGTQKDDMTVIVTRVK